MKMVSIKKKPAAESGHLLFRKYLLNLRNALLVFAITLLFELTLSLFFVSIKLRHSLLNLDHKFFIF